MPSMHHVLLSGFLLLLSCGINPPAANQQKEVPSCLESSVEECTARNCQVQMAHPYSTDAGCYQRDLRAAFCRPSPDFQCVWAGDPVVLTRPDGQSWYAEGSCFSVPQGWTVESFPQGRPACP